MNNYQDLAKLVNSIKELDNWTSSEKLLLFCAVSTAESVVRHYEQGDKQESLYLLKDQLRYNTKHPRSAKVFSRALELMGSEYILEELNGEISLYLGNGGSKNPSASSELSYSSKAYFGSAPERHQN